MKPKPTIDDSEHVSYVVFLCLMGGLGCFLSAFSIFLAVKFIHKADADIQNPIELHRIADAMDRAYPALKSISHTDTEECYVSSYTCDPTPKK